MLPPTLVVPPELLPPLETPPPDVELLPPLPPALEVPPELPATPLLPEEPPDLFEELVPVEPATFDEPESVEHPLPINPNTGTIARTADWTFI
jgi:hypothetical protein